MRCVVLDIGHGGADPGAVANGLKEKDINLKVAMYARDVLKSYGIPVYLTRETDVDLTMNQRGAFAKKYNPAIFWSIHHNAGGGYGVEIIDKHSSTEDDKLSNKFLELMGQFTKIRKRYSRLDSNGKDYFYVVRELSDSDTIAVISEGEFLDSEKGSTNLKSDAFLRNEAKCIADSIAWKMGVDTSPKNSSTTSSSSSSTAGSSNKPVTVPAWKKAGVEALVKEGLIEDSWLNKLDEPMPVWAITIILSRIVDLVNKKITKEE